MATTYFLILIYLIMNNLTEFTSFEMTAIEKSNTQGGWGCNSGGGYSGYSNYCGGGESYYSGGCGGYSNYGGGSGCYSGGCDYGSCYGGGCGGGCY